MTSPIPTQEEEGEANWAWLSKSLVNPHKPEAALTLLSLLPKPERGGLSEVRSRECHSGTRTLRLCKGKIDQSGFSDTQCILPAKHPAIQTCLDTLWDRLPHPPVAVCSILSSFEWFPVL